MRREALSSHLSPAQRKEIFNGWSEGPFQAKRNTKTRQARRINCIFGPHPLSKGGAQRPSRPRGARQRRPYVATLSRDRPGGPDGSGRRRCAASPSRRRAFSRSKGLARAPARKGAGEGLGGRGARGGQAASEGVGRCGIGAEGGRGHSARTGGGEGRGGAPPSLDRGQLDPLGTALKKLTSRHEVRAQA